MGGVRTQIPLAFWAFLIGSASLAALPVISCGFFSKEMILGSVWAAPGFGPMLWCAGILGAVLTAVYIFRAVFIVFFGPVNTTVSDSYGIRIVLPLVVLAIGALTIGWLETPAFLGGHTIFGAFLAPSTGTLPRMAISPLIPLAGIAAPLAGILIAYMLYRSGTWHAQAARAPSQLVNFLKSGCGFDIVYDALLVNPYLWLVRRLRNDPVDLLAVGAERLAVALHRRLRATQSGQLRRYAGWLMAGSLATVAMLLFG
jgi:NADH-quinone oxidoreductase subunit L